MIDKNVVKKLVDEWLQDQEYFLVDIEISPDNRIVVEIDHADGVWIEDCVALSRYIEERLSRDDEDYELEVGSAGLGQPFKVPQQYVNFVGKEVEVLDADGIKVKGILKAVDGNDFTVGVEEKNKSLSESEITGTTDEAVNILGTQTGVLSNALKLMDGKYGGAFYVRYICDTGRGCGWLQLIIEYPTGMVQTQLLCKNVCKVSTYEEDGLGEVEGISYQHKPSGEMAEHIFPKLL